MKTAIIAAWALALAPLVLFAVASAGTDNFRGDLAFPPVLIATVPVLLLRSRFVRYAAGAAAIGIWVFLYWPLGMTYIAWLYFPSAFAMLVGAVAPSNGPER